MCIMSDLSFSPVYCLTFLFIFSSLSLFWQFVQIYLNKNQSTAWEREGGNEYYVGNLLKSTTTVLYFFWCFKSLFCVNTWLCFTSDTWEGSCILLVLLDLQRRVYPNLYFVIYALYVASVGSTLWNEEIKTSCIYILSDTSYSLMFIAYVIILVLFTGTFYF